MIKTIVILLSFCLLIPSISMARNAELLLSPTRIILEKGKKYATVTLRNNGDGIGRYKIELVDTIMKENGGIKIREKGDIDPFSALSIISISPRSVTLRPDESQTIRLLIKKYKTLPEGELKSHLKIKMTESDLDLTTGLPISDGTTVALKPKVATVIPVIVRKGQPTFKVKMDKATYIQGDKTLKLAPQVAVALSFSGNRSVLGDIKVIHIAPDGKATELVFFRGIAIYRGVTKRTQKVPLKIPKGLELQDGKLKVVFLSQEKGEGKVLASTIIAP